MTALRPSVYYTFAMRVHGFIHLVVWVAITLPSVCQETASRPHLKPSITPATDGIFAAFQMHPVVALGDYHGVAQEEDFYSLLVRDPRFAANVQNVIVEFGDAAQQATLDRYLAGENVSYTELRKVWADNVGWFPTVTSIGYINFFAAVREVNAKLEPSQRIHVWLGDPPVDWAKVTTEADLPKTPRNETPATILISNILKEKKKALIIYGANHFYGHDSIKERVERSFPGAFFVVHPFAGFLEKTCTIELEKEFGSSSVPMLVAPIKETTLEDELRAPGCHFTSARSVVFPPGYTEEQKAHTVSDLEEKASGRTADAMLYLGPAENLTISPDSPDLYMDDAYRIEIMRRVKILAPGLARLPTSKENPASPRPLRKYPKE